MRSPRGPILSAPVWIRSDRLLPLWQDLQGRVEWVLAVRQRRVVVTLPPSRQAQHLGPPGEDHESKHRKISWMGAPRGPSIRAIDRKATDAVLVFLRDTNVGQMVTLAPLEEEGGGKGNAGCNSHNYTQSTAPFNPL